MKNTNSKKTLALTISLIMTACTLASCGQSETSDSRSGSTNQYNMGDAQEQNDAYTPRYTENTPEENIDMLMPDEAPVENDEEYNYTVENSFLNVSEYPLSTFSTDVDTASFTNIRRMIENGTEIDPDAVRTEEFINYLKYDYPQPQGDDAVSITTELTDCPWNSEAKLVQIGLQAKEAETTDVNSNIVFLIDVSGSMEDYDKLPLVQQAFTMLAENLGEKDTVSIVTYAGSDEVVLEGESGANYEYISKCINNLTAGGSTAGADGINTAYEIASRYFIEGGNNRVILATDGDLNVGISSEEELTALIEEKRDMGIFLSVLGFGTGNLKDNKLEALADNGNGNYAYIDSVDEARRVLVTEMNGTLFTVAKDTKVQVEFNPTNVLRYRLVGYENRLLDDEDFEDDTKDAGDIGSAQQVTALYEIIPTANANFGGTTVSKNLKYQTVEETVEETADDTLTDLDKELLTVSVRYKEPDGDESKLIDKAVTNGSYVDYERSGSNVKLACCAAEFALFLRNSDYISSEITPSAIRSEINNYGLDSSGDLLSLIDNYIYAYYN